MRTTNLNFTTIDLGSNTELVTRVSYNGAITTQKQNYRIGDYGELSSDLTAVKTSSLRWTFFHNGFDGFSFFDGSGDLIIES